LRLATRLTREGVTVVEHGGDLPGYHSYFMLVPEKQFAMTMLTNSEGGPSLVSQLFIDDWALKRFAGVSNMPAPSLSLNLSELVPYEGDYAAQRIAPDSNVVEFPGQLQAT
jgi:hypothetical protein